MPEFFSRKNRKKETEIRKLMINVLKKRLKIFRSNSSSKEQHTRAYYLENNANLRKNTATTTNNLTKLQQKIIEHSIHDPTEFIKTVRTEFTNFVLSKFTEGEAITNWKLLVFVQEFVRLNKPLRLHQAALALNGYKLQIPQKLSQTAYTSSINADQSIPTLPNKIEPQSKIISATFQTRDGELGVMLSKLAVDENGAVKIKDEYDDKKTLIIY